MNRKIMMIMIAALVLLIGIGAASASESNATDAVVSSPQDDLISVSNDEVVAVENESVDAVLAVESDDAGDEALAVEKEKSDVLAVEKDNSAVAVSNDEGALKAKKEEKVALSSDSKVLGASKGKTVYKTVTLGKQVYPKKYYKFMAGYTPAKSNKKAWRNYVAFKKYSAKSLSNLKKQSSRVLLKVYLNGWGMVDGSLNYSYKVTSKYVILRYYAKFYKTV